MDLRTVFSPLARHRRIAVGVVLISAYLGLSTAYSVSLLPPGIEAKPLEFATAGTRLLVDSRQSTLADVHAATDPLVTRAAVYTELLASPEMKDRVAREAGVPPERLAAVAHVASLYLTRSDKEPSAEERGNQIADEDKEYRLFVESEPLLPAIRIATQAPTIAEAERLAEATGAVLRTTVTDLQTEQRIPAHRRVDLRQLGSAEGGVVNSGVNVTVAVIAVMTAVPAALFALLLALRAASAVRAAIARRPEPRPVEPVEAA
jgi:hypothetical protein